MSRSIRAAVYAAFLCAWLAFPAPAAGQVIPGGLAPTAEECRAAITALSNVEQDVTRWQIVPDCGPAGARALAAALAGAGAQPATLYLQTLSGAAASVRDGDILAAAEALARDRSATRAARVAGLLTLLGQYDAALRFPLYYSWDQLVAAPLPACKLSPLTDSGYAAQHAMPPDYVDRIRAALQDVGREEAADPVVRSMAACLGRHVR